MFLSLLPYLISGAASIGSAFIQNFGAKSRQDQMNAYNTPSAQMARYGAAGLNPNLIYGQGTPGNQPGPVPYSAPTVDPAELLQKYHAVHLTKAMVRHHNVSSGAEELSSFYKKLQGEATRPFLDRNAEYSSEMLKHRIAQMVTSTHGLHLGNVNRSIEADLKRMQLHNLGLDSLIKGNTINEGLYYQGSRKQYGIEKGDNVFLRGAYRMLEYLKSQRPK